MIVGKLKEIAQDCPKNVRLMGIDVGTKTIGLALSDPAQSIVTPLKTIERKKFAHDMAQIGAVIQEFEVGGLVFGWPLNMDGSEGASCDRVRSMIDELEKNHTDQLGRVSWIALWDERLSTAAVHDFLIEEVDMSHKRRGDVVDKLAAQIILQGALESML